ncbi:thiamine-binding protein [Flavobacteriaceae sp. LMIT009]
MEVSVEFTLLPLQDEFELPIQRFIKVLRSSEFEVLENPLSTQVYGEYKTLMTFLTELIEDTFQNIDQVVLNMKIVKTNRSDYEPDF